MAVKGYTTLRNFGDRITLIRALLNTVMNRPPIPPNLGGTGLLKAPRIGGLGAAKIIKHSTIHSLIQQRPN